MPSSQNSDLTRAKTRTLSLVLLSLSLSLRLSRLDSARARLDLTRAKDVLLVLIPSSLLSSPLLFPLPPHFRPTKQPGTEKCKRKKGEGGISFCARILNLPSSLFSRKCHRINVANQKKELEKVLFWRFWRFRYILHRVFCWAILAELNC